MFYIMEVGDTAVGIFHSKHRDNAEAYDLLYL